MKAYFDTNKGIIRKNNEDNLIIHETKRYKLYAVADGMGGHKAGEVASSMAISLIKDYFDENHEKDDFKIPMFINNVVEIANSKIIQESLLVEEYAGMGTTLTMAIIDLVENVLYIGNVGDSRTYLIRNDDIEQITEDHTFVQGLVKQGKITLEEARNHPKRNIITRAVGSDEKVIVDIFEIELLKNDILLLCSDGLTTHIKDEEILHIIKKYGTDESVKKLIKLCNDNGGTDNITLIIVDNKYRGDNL